MRGVTRSAGTYTVYGDGVELVQIGEHLRRESNELVLASAWAGLSLNPNTRQAEELRSSLGLVDLPAARVAGGGGVA